jgi:hypothetical protein
MSIQAISSKWHSCSAILMMLLFCTSTASAYTIHIKSPWPDNTLYICGNQEFGWWSGRQMTNEGNGWFSVTPSITQKSALEELKVYPTITHTTDMSIGSIDSWYSNGTGLENDVYIIVNGNNSVQVSFTQPNTSISSTPLSSAASTSSATNGTSSHTVTLVDTHDPGLIAMDTLWIEEGDSIDISAIGIDISRWAGTGTYELLNDSTIRAKPTENAVYQVYNIVQAGLQNINPGFEEPVRSGGTSQIHHDNVPGWKTTASDSKIEIWSHTAHGVTSYEGHQHVELNATMVGDLYQDISTVPGAIISISFAHRGRQGVDVMGLKAGPPGGPYTTIGQYSDGTTAWGVYKELYAVPAGQTTTRIFFTSEEFTGSSIGNFLDDIKYSVVEEHMAMDSIVVLVGEQVPVEHEAIIEIRFTDSEGNIIDPSTTPLGEWSLVSYPVQVGVFEDGSPTDEIDIDLSLYSEDGLIFTDASGNEIQEIRTTAGVAQFWVRADSPVSNGSFLVGRDDVDQILSWEPIHLEEPEFSVPTSSIAFDANGDGIADSLNMHFNKALRYDDVPDSLIIEWGGQATSLPWSTLETKLEGTKAIFLGRQALTDSIFTGSQEATAYAGIVHAYYTLGEAPNQTTVHLETPLSDGVGPVIRKAYLTEGQYDSQVTLTYSEYVTLSEDAEITDFFEWKRSDRSSDELQSQEIVPRMHQFRREGLTAILPFSQTQAPVIGDSVRFAFPSTFVDASGIESHELNPMCPITGTPRVKADPLHLANIPEHIQENQGDSFNNGTDDSTWTLTLIESHTSLDDAFATHGRAGLKIDVDVGSYLLANSDIEVEELSLHWQAEVFSNLGQFIAKASGTLHCDDPVFEGDCVEDQRVPYIAWNFKSHQGRLVGNGAYIMRVLIRVQSENRRLMKTSKTWTMGVMR